MPRRFYELSSDVQIPGRWYLGDPLEEDPWQFTEGGPVHVEDPLRVPIYKPGQSLEFSLSGTGIPIVHVRAAALFSELAPGDVQLLPVDVVGAPERFGILVATRLIRCIDNQRSTEVRSWKPEDEQPDKVGEYRSVHGLRIDGIRPAKDVLRAIAELSGPGHPSMHAEESREAGVAAGRRGV